MSDLLCGRCGKSIEPGSAVEFVGMDPSEVAARRILTDGDVIIVHKECPSP